MHSVFEDLQNILLVLNLIFLTKRSSRRVLPLINFESYFNQT
jgi:hypothetical protein